MGLPYMELIRQHAWHAVGLHGRRGKKEEECRWSCVPMAMPMCMPMIMNMTLIVPLLMQMPRCSMLYVRLTSRCWLMDWRTALSDWSSVGEVSFLSSSIRMKCSRYLK